MSRNAGERVLEIEHRIYPEALRLLASDGVRLEDASARPRPLLAQAIS